MFSNLALDILGSFMKKTKEKKERNRTSLKLPPPPLERKIFNEYVYYFYQVSRIEFDVIDFGYS